MESFTVFLHVEGKYVKENQAEAINSLVTHNFTNVIILYQSSEEFEKFNQLIQHILLQ